MMNYEIEQNELNFEVVFFAFGLVWFGLSLLYVFETRSKMAMIC